MNYKKVLILGSGALKIGEAGEFDYSGSQAIKALKEEGIKTVLINPNIVTIQTSEHLADEVYFLPVQEYFVEQVIKKEKPDGILISFGGQTALNTGMSLYRKGILQKYHLPILGTPIESVIIAEDRDLFAQHLRKIKLPTPESQAAGSVAESVAIAKRLGYPLMVRAGYTLGGQKSGVVFNQAELQKKVSEALSFSPQVLIEKYLHHFKEIEYEVVRDRNDNCITVCNMENMDPLGIHTGESIVVAPSQTLTNFEYHFLRQKAIELVRSLNIVGECNVQYALNPSPTNGEIDYYIIELNPRLSRSSALASKATGYPLAYVAAKLIIGKSLKEIKNQVTQVTQSFFEPALDYLVVKMPRWDLEKFSGVEATIGSSMKSVGEVMAIGRSFEEAIQKAVRMLDIDAEGVTEYTFPKNKKEFIYYLEKPTPKRLFAVAEAFKRNFSVAELYEITGIDPWFLYRIKEIVDAEKQLTSAKNALSRETMLQLKQLGFSDKKIGQLVGKRGLEIRDLRASYKMYPSVFQIDTLAGEFPAQTNYLYMTYHGNHHDVTPLGKQGVVVLGSGPYRIGTSVEFDWSSVNTVLTLGKYKKKSVIVNCNPETVSTDYDMSDRLYFEELSFERVMDIYEFENPMGMIGAVGGQRPNTLAKSLHAQGVKLMGTSAEDIDRAEDRNKFSKLLDDLHIAQPYWRKVSRIQDAVSFADSIGFPVLIRPSYVLSGAAMYVCYTHDELAKHLKRTAMINREHPVTISKYFQQAKEIELDGVAQNGEVIVYAVAEHIEHAGVHSGDATIIYPPERIYLRTEQKIVTAMRTIVNALHVTGPFNIQFLARDNKVYVIEINLRASRSFPFISKAAGVNLATMIVDTYFGKAKPVSLKYPDYSVVKSAQFSFARLEGADPELRVEMASTGEVGCFGTNFEKALLLSIYATGVRIREKTAFLSVGGIVNKKLFLESARLLEEMGFILYATSHTHAFLKSHGVSVNKVQKVYEKGHPNVLDLIEEGNVSMVVNVSDKTDAAVADFNNLVTDGYLIRRAAIDKNIPLFTNLKLAQSFIKAISMYSIEHLDVLPWSAFRRHI